MASPCVDCQKQTGMLIRAECGHTVCMSCFREKSSLSSCCSECWNFSRSRTVQAAMSMYPEGESICQIHREDQKLFCDRTKTLLCVNCSKSMGHEKDVHWPVAVAAMKHRNMIQVHIETLTKKLNEAQNFLSKEKKQPLIWAVAWSDSGNINQQLFQENFYKTWDHMKNKLNDEEVSWRDNKRLVKLFQELKEVEATHELHLMEEKKKWEAMMSRQNKSITDTITEWQEKMLKSDVEILQDVAQTSEHSWDVVRLYMRPFRPKINLTYASLATAFLKAFSSDNLLNKYNFYDLSGKRKKRAILIVPNLPGKPYLVYIHGSVDPEDIRGKTFFIHSYPWNQIAGTCKLHRPVITLKNFS